MKLCYIEKLNTVQKLSFKRNILVLDVYKGNIKTENFSQMLQYSPGFNSKSFERVLSGW